MLSPSVVISSPEYVEVKVASGDANLGELTEVFLLFAAHFSRPETY